jgi:hypothetical protein
MILLMEALCEIILRNHVGVDFLSDLASGRMDALYHVTQATVSDDKQVDVAAGMGCAIGG